MNRSDFSSHLHLNDWKKKKNRCWHPKWLKTSTASACNATFSNIPRLKPQYLSRQVEWGNWACDVQDDGTFLWKFLDVSCWYRSIHHSYSFIIYHASFESFSIFHYSSSSPVSSILKKICVKQKSMKKNIKQSHIPKLSCSQQHWVALNFCKAHDFRSFFTVQRQTVDAESSSWTQGVLI